MNLPAWAFMWMLTSAIYLACKGWTLQAAHAGAAPLGRRLAYVFLWPGMDAAGFLNGRGGPSGRHDSWLEPTACVAFGAALLWGGARRVGAPLAAGWLGMVGLILVLHFGLFGLVALGWQQLGFRAPLLMQHPLRAASPSDFWGRRWNTAFHDLVTTCLLSPLRRRCGVAGAVLLIFLFSGLVHDFVLSVPAGGGYGGPTLYFTLQGGAVLLERSPVGRRLGLRGGWRGRALLFASAGLPLGALFHPPFVRHVMLPFFHALHTL